MSRKLCAIALALPALCAIGAETIPSEPVVVSATRFAQPLADKPPYATLIDRRQIEASPARTLPELLMQYGPVTGPDLYGNNSTLTTMDLGGFGASAGQNTLILVDGRRVSDIDLSGVNWSAIPLATVERVEILRGGGAVQYGDGASAGVINVITRSAATAGTSARLGGGIASHDTQRVQVEAAHGAGSAGFGILANHYDSDGYRANNRNLQNVVQGDFNWRQDDYSTRLSLIADSQRLRLPGGRLVNRDTGVDLLQSDRRGAATPLDYSTRAGLQVNLDLSSRQEEHEAALGLGYRDKAQTSYFDFSGFPDYREVDLKVLSANPRLRLSSRGEDVRNDLVMGMDFYSWDYRLALAASPTLVAQPVHRVRGDQSNSSFYLLDTLSVGRILTLTAGARVEQLRLRADDAYDASAPDPTFIGGSSSNGTQRETQHAWELGVHMQPTAAFSLGARASRSYRFATVDEIYEFSPSFVRVFQFLRPQVNRGYELSSELRIQRAALTGSLFHTDVTDEIHLDPFGTGVGNTNLPPTRRRGLSLGTRVDVEDLLTLSWQFTYTEAKFRSGVLTGSGFTRTASLAGKQVPLVPRTKFNLALELRPSERVSLTSTLVHVGAQFMENDEDNSLGERIPAYRVIDLKARYAAPSWAVDFVVNNLTDRKYYSYAVRSASSARRFNAYPLPERTFGLNLELQFK